MAEEENQSSLELKISNKTQDITLKFHGGPNSPQLTPELPPGSSDSWDLLSAPDALSTGQALLYEAESFTLAVSVRVCEMGHESLSALQLELCPDRSHLRDVDLTLRRLSCLRDAAEPGQTLVSRCVFSSRYGGGFQMVTGSYKVTAVLEHQPRSVLEVELGEREPVALDLEDLEPPACTIL